MSDSSEVIKPAASDQMSPTSAPSAPQKKSSAPQKLPKRPRGKVSSGSPKIVRRMGVKKVRARRVRRTIRHVDPWSVFKIALPLCACIYFALVVAFTLLLKAIDRAGLIEKIEDFATTTLQFETFEIQIEIIEDAIIVVGLVLAVVTAASLVLGAVLFNLISDIMGGIRVSVIEEEPAVRVKQRNPRGGSQQPKKKPRPAQPPGSPSRTPSAPGPNTAQQTPRPQTPRPQPAKQGTQPVRQAPQNAATAPQRPQTQSPRPQPPSSPAAPPRPSGEV